MSFCRSVVSFCRVDTVTQKHTNKNTLKNNSDLRWPARTSVKQLFEMRPWVPRLIFEKAISNACMSRDLTTTPFSNACFKLASLRLSRPHFRWISSRFFTAWSATQTSVKKLWTSFLETEYFKHWYISIIYNTIIATWNFVKKLWYMNQNTFE